MPPVQDIHFREPAARAAEAAQMLRPSPSLNEELQDVQGEKMVLNMGPSHPKQRRTWVICIAATKRLPRT